MSRFKLLNNNMNDILLSIIENQTLCKLIEYNSDNPFKEPDLEDPSSLLFNKISPLPKIPDTKTEASSFLNINFDAFRLPRNRGLKDGLILFDVICHTNLWQMKGTGMIRPLSILHEIDEMFNSQRIVGVKKHELERFKLLFINEHFSGYQVGYQIVIGN